MHQPTSTYIAYNTQTHTRTHTHTHVQELFPPVQEGALLNGSGTHTHTLTHTQATLNPRPELNQLNLTPQA